MRLDRDALVNQGVLFGATGERLAWDILMHSPWAKSVVDVRDDRRFQQMDVDFLVEMANRQYARFEVKTDRLAHESGNICYETKSSPKTIGCFEKTQADYMMYFLCNAKPQEMYLISVPKLRAFLKDKIAKGLTPKKMGDCGEGYLLKISELTQDPTLMKKIGIGR